MKIIVISDSIPDTSHGGGAVTVAAIIKSLQTFKAKVDMLAIDRLTKIPRNKSQNILKTYLLPFKILRNLFSENMSFPEITTSQHEREEAASIIKAGKYDCIVCYHWKAIDLVRNIQDISIVGLVGDPFDLPGRMRLLCGKKPQNFIETCRRFFMSSLILLKYRKAWQRMLHLLNRCSVSGAFAAHHALEFQTGGAPGCYYVRTPISGTTLKTKRLKNKKFTLVHVGHFLGTATLSGVELLCDEILPCLDKRIGIDRFQLNMIGGSADKIPYRLQEKLTFFGAKLLGKKALIGPELMAADVVIVPTPIYLGIRVRICTALAYGCCVVTHIANTAGIPELMDFENCLVAKDGNDFCNKIIEIYKNPRLKKKLQKGAFETHQNYFSLSRAGRAIYGLCEKAAARDSRVAAN